jgi:hypothetical protein
MIAWPPSLVREVAARRCVFFLGAGVSASASDKDGNHPSTWKEFLEKPVISLQKPQRNAL